MTFTFKLIAAVILFFLSIISGVVLSKSGRPLKTTVFTLHKLLALASVVFAGIIIYNLHQSLPMKTTEIILLSATVISILGIFVTGAFLSFEKSLPALVLILHKTFTVTSLVSAALIKYFLSDKF